MIYRHAFIDSLYIKKGASIKTLLLFWKVLNVVLHICMNYEDFWVF